jgi:hypothetical protein
MVLLHSLHVLNSLSSHHALACNRYSWGGPVHNPIVAIPSLSTVATYDILNRALVLVRCGGAGSSSGSSSGGGGGGGGGGGSSAGVEVRTLAIDLHPRNLISPRPVGITQLHDETTLALYAVEGRHVALVACDTGVTATAELPEGFVIKKAECFGPDALLLTVVQEHRATATTTTTSGDEHPASFICYLISEWAGTGTQSEQGVHRQPHSSPQTNAATRNGARVPLPRGVAMGKGSEWVNGLTHVVLVPAHVAPAAPSFDPARGFVVDHFATTANVDRGWAPVPAAGTDLGAGWGLGMCTAPALVAGYALFAPPTPSVARAHTVGSACRVMGHPRIDDGSGDDVDHGHEVLGNAGESSHTHMPSHF